MTILYFLFLTFKEKIIFVAEILKILKNTTYILIFLLLLSACSGTKYLTDNQYFLEAQAIKGNKVIAIEELEPFFRQKPNRKIPLLGEPYVVAYYWGKKSYDKKINIWQKELDSLQSEYSQMIARRDSMELETSEVDDNKQYEKLRAKKEKKLNNWKEKVEKGNWLMSSVGDAPTFFDSAVMVKTASQMQLFLKQKGFFNSKVKPSYVIKNQRATITYLIEENKPRIIGRFVLASEDSTLLLLVKKDSANILVRQGERFDEGKLSQERDRLSKILQNQGYMSFSKQFIYFDVDTVNVGKDTLDIRMVVLSDENKKPHTQFKIGKVDMITDIGTEVEEIGNSERQREEYQGINYLAYKQKYSKKLLNSRIRIRPNELYSRTDIEDTQRALASLDVFKFVNVKPDTVNHQVLTTIFASPAPINDVSMETGLNMVQTFPGPFVGVTLKNRNTFGACETLELRGRFSLEAQAGVIGTGTGYVGQEASINATINFPKLLFFGEKFNNRVGAYLPRTKLSAGYTDIDRPEYSRTNFRTTLTYDWTNKKNSTFSFNLFDVTVVNTERVTDAFVKYMLNIASGGNTLLRSFDRLFISSISFNYTFFKNNNFYIRGLGELGGTTLNLLNRQFFKEGEVFGLTAFRYIKANVELRRYIPLQKNNETNLVLRANFGVITPYGKIGGKPNTILPYEKYFFTGGTNSIRAWRPRRLGPGSFAQIDEKGNLSDLIEQPGELLLEMNMELRKKLFGFVHGAFFIDAGNTWMLTQNSRQGSQFLFKSFWNEIAVGTGLGLRFDFSLVIMRFDFGIKVWNPALPLSQRFVLPRWTLDQTTFNLGIGYPF
ncbi:MAG: BamA/TamA family outer membrane protein [Thermoflexibacter sp.]|jgi:outer membrane protein assembly factor BamA|nr:BamA/TamA family outer membrane protein [Thermoflexibacter sp.]